MQKTALQLHDISHVLAYSFVESTDESICFHTTNNTDLPMCKDSKPPQRRINLEIVMHNAVGTLPSHTPNNSNPYVDPIPEALKTLHLSWQDLSVCARA
jgi:hypothetical protein